MYRLRQRQSLTRLLTFHFPLAIFLSFVLLPFLWAISISFKNESEILSPVFQYFPHHISFENYIKVWNLNKFSTYFINSLFISFMAVVFIVIFSIANAYAMSRFKFKGKSIFLFLLLGTQLMPVVLFVIPLFLLFKSMGLINTPYAIILFYIVSQVPFNSLLMKGFVDSIPKEIDEAAMVDGASRMRVMTTIIVPVILPGIVATSSFAFIGCWNEFLVAFSFITATSKFTIPIGLKFMIGEYSIDYSSLAAGSIIGLIPPVILFAYIQRFLIEGMSSGSVKG
jgi:multiple sugar transport system permease protein